MTWPQHPDKPLPPIGSPGPREIALWPIADRALAWPEDATEGLARLRPAPPRYAGRRRSTPYGLARTILAVGISTFLIWLAFVIGNLPVWG